MNGENISFGQMCSRLAIQLPYPENFSPWKPHDNLDDLGLASAADENAISTTSSLVVNAIHEVAGDPSAIGYAERTFVHVKRQAHHFGEISCANLGKHLLTSSPAKTRKSP